MPKIASNVGLHTVFYVALSGGYHRKLTHEMEIFDAHDGLPLRSGLLLRSVRSSDIPILDALNRPALARTTIIGATLEIELTAGLSTEEISITLYHEVLEAASVAALDPPSAVCDLNEAGFESAARRMHADLGTATSATLNQMLALFGF